MSEMRMEWMVKVIVGEEIITVVVRCRVCKTKFQTKISREEYERAPLVIYCQKCKDFTLADVTKVLEDEEKIMFYKLFREFMTKLHEEEMIFYKGVSYG